MTDLGRPGFRTTQRTLRSLRPSEIGALVSLWTIAIAAPEMLGGVPTWSLVAIAAGGMVALGCALRATRRAEETKAFEPVLVIMAGALAYTTVQAIPLPCAVVRWIDPELAGHVAENARLLPSASFACSFSWAPGATRWEVVKGVGIVALFAAAWLLSVRGLRRWVLGSVATSVLTIALVGLAHRAADAEHVFGLVALRFPMERPILSPISNPNNLAGFLSMGVPVFAGFALAERALAKRLLYLSGAAVIGATTAMTLSRGGVAALGVGLVVFAGLELTARVRRDGRARVAWIAVLCVGILGLAGWVSAEPILGALGDHDLSKLDLIREAIRLTERRPWSGVGRGAFATAFAALDPAVARYRADHAENAFVHWATEWGWPLALLLVIAIAIRLLRQAQRRISSEHRGAIAGVLSLAVSNLVDFNLELGGVAAVAAILLAAAVAPRGSRAVESARRREVHGGALRPWLRFGALARGVAWTSVPLVAGMAASAGAASFVYEDALVASLEIRDREAFRATLREAVAHHPAEPSFALLAGAEAVIHGDRSAGRWLGRSMRLAPTWPEPHRFAAEGLLRIGALDQALLEIREAAVRMPGAGAPLLCRLLRVRPDAALVDRAAPPPPHRAEFLETVASCAPPGPVQAAIDGLMLEGPHPPLAVRIRQVLRLLAAGNRDGALTELRTLETHGVSPRNRLALASAFLRAGAPKDALTVLARVPNEGSDRRSLLVLRAKAHASLGHTDAMRATVDELKAEASASPERLAEAFELLGGLEQSLGHSAVALRELDRACRIAPTPSRLLRVARAAERLGDPVRAYRAYADLCARHPENDVGCRKKKELAGNDAILGSGSMGRNPP